MTLEKVVRVCLNRQPGWKLCRESKWELVWVWVGLKCQGCAEWKWTKACRFKDLHQEFHWALKPPIPNRPPYTNKES